MWYMETFSLTPFEDRYLVVPYEWMEFSYLQFMENPGNEAYRDWYLMKKAEDKKNEEYEKNLKAQVPALQDSRYTETEINDIMKAFRDTK